MKIVHIISIILFAFFINVSTGQEKKDTAVEQKTYHEKMKYCCDEDHKMKSDKSCGCRICNKNMNLSPKEKMKYEVTRYFSCPHHRRMKMNKKGICPKCKKPLEMHEEKH